MSDEVDLSRIPKFSVDEFPPNNTIHVYCRVSTSIQEEEGSSLETQQKLGEEYCKKNNMKYILWNEGGESSFGEDFGNRVVLMGLMERVKNGDIKKVWVLNDSRLGRNEYLRNRLKYEFKQNHVSYIVGEREYDFNNPQDNLMNNILTSFSQYDNEVRSFNLKMGKLKKVKEGIWVWGKRNFGFDIKDKKPVINKFESEWIKKIFTYYDDGKSVSEIRDILVENGVENVHRRDGYIGKRGRWKGIKDWGWSSDSLYSILNNDFYGGWKKYSGEKIPFPPIFVTDKEKKLYERVLRKRKERSRVNKTKIRVNVKKSYLLNEIIFCGGCGAKLTTYTDGKKITHYKCSNKLQDYKRQDYLKSGCNFKRSIETTNLDESVWISLVNLIQNSSHLYKLKKDEWVKEIDQKGIKEKNITQKLNKGLERKEKFTKSLTSYNTLLEVEGNKGNDFKQRIKVIENELLTINRDTEKWENELKELGSSNIDSNLFIKYFDEIEEMLMWNEEKKKENIEKFIHKIVLNFDNDKNQHVINLHLTFPISLFDNNNGDFKQLKNLKLKWVREKELRYDRVLTRIKKKLKK